MKMDRKIAYLIARILETNGLPRNQNSAPVELGMSIASSAHVAELWQGQPMGSGDRETYVELG